MSETDERRTKPRVFLVLSPEERAALDAIAEADGESRSAVVGRLVAAEAERRGL